MQHIDTRLIEQVMGKDSQSRGAAEAGTPLDRGDIAFSSENPHLASVGGM